MSVDGVLAMVLDRAAAIVSEAASSLHNLLTTVEAYQQASRRPVYQPGDDSVGGVGAIVDYKLELEDIAAELDRIARGLKAAEAEALKKAGPGTIP